jgi:hypothetical protein
LIISDKYLDGFCFLTLPQGIIRVLGYDDNNNNIRLDRGSRTQAAENHGQTTHWYLRLK